MKYTFDEKNHIHLLDGKPLIGTSTAIKVLNKPLTWWAAGMAVGKLGWTNSKIKENGKYKTIPVEERLKIATPVFEEIKKLTPVQYLDKLDEAYRAHNEKKNESAEKGTDRHELLEKYVKLMIEDQDGKPKELNSYEDESVKKFVQWSVTNVKKFLWSEIHCYSEKLWVGGIADAGWLDMNDVVVAADFKSSKEAYFDQWLQIGGYDEEISENGGFTSNGEKIFTLPKPIGAYCVIPFGGEVFTPELKYDVESYKQGFSSAVHLYKLSNSN